MQMHANLSHLPWEQLCAGRHLTPRSHGNKWWSDTQCDTGTQPHPGFEKAAFLFGFINFETRNGFAKPWLGMCFVGPLSVLNIVGFL